MESYLRSSKNKKRLADIESGILGWTWSEAVQVMAEELAQQFARNGAFNGIDTPLQSHIAEAAKRVEGKDTPLSAAFQSTLGKKRMTTIRKLARARVLAKAELCGEPHRSALLAGLAWFNATHNSYKGMGWGTKYTVPEAHDLVVSRIETAALRYLESAKKRENGNASASLPGETLELARNFEAAELSLTSPQMSALEAACQPLSTDGLAIVPLVSLMQWSNDFGSSDHLSFEALTNLANQCAKLIDLNTSALKALAHDVARRVHHPFGLMETDRHANMIAAQYLFAGETPSQAMVFAWRLLEQANAVMLLHSENYDALLQRTLASLTQGIEIATRYNRGLSYMPGRPSAVDVIRLLASAVVAAHDDPTVRPSWPADLLDAVLSHYAVDEEQRPSVAVLLAIAFPLPDNDAQSADWTNPDLEWVSVGSTYLYRLVRFVWESPWLGQSDLEDLKSRTDERVPLSVLKDFRDCHVRAESPFTNGDRREFTSQGVLNTNSWLKQNLERSATREFARVASCQKGALQEIRRQASGRLIEEIKSATGQGPVGPLGSSGGWEFPEDWFTQAASPESVKKLSKLLSSENGFLGMNATETKKAAGHLLNFLNLASNDPLVTPRRGQTAQNWLTELIEKTNTPGAYGLEEPESGHGNEPWDLDPLEDMIQIDIYDEQNLAILLEATIRQIQAKDAK
ncbi:hypothetical protein DM793_04005 [Paenarthrobacter nitroguajacolicus]|nr:hypothetical protein [Paenarthrobacter nitroguajacolicus]